MKPGIICHSAMTACQCLGHLRCHLFVSRPKIEIPGAGWAGNYPDQPNRRMRGLVLSLLLPLCSLVVVAPAQAQDAVTAPAAPAAPAADTGVVVDRFEFRYGLDHPELPALAELSQLNIRLTRDGDVWRPATADTGEVLTLGGIPAGSRFDGEALRSIAQELVRWYNVRGLYGVWVAFLDLESAGAGIADNRAPDDRTARMVIWASQVAEVRTLARGKRFKAQFSVNNRKHRGVISHSPLQPGASPDQPGSLFRQDVLNKYLHGLSLHPGRLVEASIASAGDPGKVVLDYLVNESKSWQVYSQVTNFGTEATGVWRSRLGFQHNQLTNHDDILNVDAITTPDFKTYGSFLSYRIPVFRPARLLARVYGSYGDFLATDAEFATLRYAGRNWLGGIELTNRLSLPRNWQLVSTLGANYAHYAVQNLVVDQDEGTSRPLSGGFSNFLIPFFTATLSREANWWSLSGGGRYDHTVGDMANLNTTDGISTLGRGSDVDKNWSSLRWNASGTIYLEPLFLGSERARFTANEISFRARGRMLLRSERLNPEPGEPSRGGRLIPHEQEPIGGAFSVRGYTESILAADEFATASIEYALHFPRLLKPGEASKVFGREFKWRPGKARQNADWDLIGRVFYDYAWRQVTPQPLETGQDPNEPVTLSEITLTLAGAGGGIELQVKQNFSLRFDVGMSLTELRDETREEGQRLVYPAGKMQYYISSSFSW